MRGEESGRPVENGWREKRKHVRRNAMLLFGKEMLRVSKKGSTQTNSSSGEERRGLKADY